MSGQASQNIVASTWTKHFTPPEKLPAAADVVIPVGCITFGGGSNVKTLNLIAYFAESPVHS